VTAVVVAAERVDTSALAHGWRSMREQPLVVGAVMAAYGLAFVIRARVWQRVLPTLTFGHAVAAIHVTLLGNHLLPLRLGEPLRVASVVRRAGIGLRAAAGSTVALRSGDMLGLAVLGAVLGPGVTLEVVGRWGFAALVVAAGVAGLVAWWFLRRGKRGTPFQLPRAFVALGSTLAWVLESIVVWQAARWVGVPISPFDAVVVTAVAVGSQLVGVAPGGFGTFEAAGTAALVALGVDPGPALAAILTAHALTAGYGIVTGAVAMVVPRPPMGSGLLRPFGRPLPRAGRGTQPTNPSGPDPGALDRASTHQLRAPIGWSGRGTGVWIEPHGPACQHQPHDENSEHRHRHDRAHLDPAELQWLREGGDGQCWEPARPQGRHRPAVASAYTEPGQDHDEHAPPEAHRPGAGGVRNDGARDGRVEGIDLGQGHAELVGVVRRAREGMVGQDEPSSGGSRDETGHEHECDRDVTTPRPAGPAPLPRPLP
jgi:uncharacterized membrane protein YbhN (UPF0104 family)